MTVTITDGGRVLQTVEITPRGGEAYDVDVSNPLGVPGVWRRARCTHNPKESPTHLVFRALRAALLDPRTP